MCPCEDTQAIDQSNFGGNWTHWNVLRIGWNVACIYFHCKLSMNIANASTCSQSFLLMSPVQPISCRFSLAVDSFCENSQSILVCNGEVFCVPCQ